MVELILHGRDMDEEHDDVLSSCSAQHTQVGSQLGESFVLEVRRTKWLESNGLEDLLVCPTCGVCFYHHGEQGQQTDAYNITP